MMPNMLLRNDRTIVLEGRDTVLRRFERRDVDRWLAWPRHPDPLFHNYNPPILTARQRDHYFRARDDASDLLQFAVEDRRGELIGRISFRDIDYATRCSVLGITFHPYRLGRGLGTDALRVMLEHYFRAMGMKTLFLDVAAFNKRAHRCYEKCGFQTTGHHWGEPHPDYAGVMYRPEYVGIRHLFRSHGSFIRPLLVDMVLRREQFLRPEAP
jgi:diamine N-acetyltransferase